MKVSGSTLIIGLVCVGLLFGFGYQYGQAKKAKEALDSIVESKKIEVADLEMSIRDMREEVKSITEAGKQHRIESDRLIADLKIEREASRRERELRVTTAEPEEVLSETRRLLGTEEIWLVETQLVMSDAASRLNLKQLLENQTFKMVEIPMLSAALLEMTQTATKYEAALAITEEREGIHDSISALKDSISKDFENYAKTIKRNTLKDTLLWVGVGVIVGGGLVLLAK